MNGLEGKVAFVTGGDSGIGLGISYALTRAGMRVAITYRTPEHLEQALELLGGTSTKIHAINLDVTDRRAVAGAVAETLSVFGKVHILVCNAGVAPMTPLSSATFSDWDWCMNVNVNGVFNCVREFLPHIVAHGEGGQVVATSSMLGGLIVGPFWGVYSTSKFAIVGMMEALRSELAATNIGVSVFCPAGVKSRLGNSERNRPSGLAETGTPPPTVSALISKFEAEVEPIVSNESELLPFMDSLEAGDRVLQGIRNNDLYILSHPEYEQAIRDRHEAICASIPQNENQPSHGRLALAQLFCNSVYVEDLRRKRSLRGQIQ